MFNLFRSKSHRPGADRPASREGGDKGAVYTVALDGDPEAVAAQLLEPHLPPRRLDEVRIRTEEDLGQVIAMLFLRRGLASLEKDEIIAFVEGSRPHVERLLETLDAFSDAGRRVEDGEQLAEYFAYVSEHIGHAYRREYDRMDVRSDKLFWLIYVLSAQLGSGLIDAAGVESWLRRPDIRGRITSHQLGYMLMDFAESYSTPSQPRSEMLAVIGLAARIGDKLKEASAAFSLCVKIGNFESGAESCRLLDNIRQYLESRNSVAPEDRARFEQLAQRFGTPRPRHDF